MKFNLRYLANLFVAALLFCATGCKDDDTSGPEIACRQDRAGRDDRQQHFLYGNAPEYADAAAYVCVEKGMLIPSAENILANGTALTLDKESLVEVKNLKDTTVYVVAAAAKMGDQIGNVVSVEIKTGAYDGVLNIIDATQSVDSVPYQADVGQPVLSSGHSESLLGLSDRGRERFGGRTDQDRHAETARLGRPGREDLYPDRWRKGCSQKPDTSIPGYGVSAGEGRLRCGRQPDERSRYPDVRDSRKFRFGRRNNRRALPDHFVPA